MNLNPTQPKQKSVLGPASEGRLVISTAPPSANSLKNDGPKLLEEQTGWRLARYFLLLLDIAHIKQASLLASAVVAISGAAPEFDTADAHAARIAPAARVANRSPRALDAPQMAVVIGCGSWLKRYDTAIMAAGGKLRCGGRDPTAISQDRSVSNFVPCVPKFVPNADIGRCRPMVTDDIMMKMRKPLWHKGLTDFER